MNKLTLLFAVGLGVLSVIGLVALGIWLRSPLAEPVVINGTSVPPVPTLNAERVTQGQQLYAQYCAQCHGANLEGGPNWRQHLADGSLPPPPHDSSGHTWHHSDTLLTKIIIEGSQAVYGDGIAKLNMPAFRDKLTQAEVATVLDFIKSKWGKDQREFQWWITVTRAE